MTNRVIIIADPFQPNVREEHVVNDHCAFLASRWKHLPTYMALYHGRVGVDTNVTPKDAAGIEYLQSLKGDIIAVQYPQEPVTIGYIAYALIFVAVLVTLNGIDAPPAVGTGRNSSPPSANNDLSSRTNKARPNGRIPDIFGEVISVPDVLSKTYSTFVDHEEREHGYFCIGRGSYLIEEIKDDTTLVSQIEGASANVFAPNTSPNSSVVAPTIVVGENINERIMTVVKTEAVNGQSMPAPNEDAFTTNFQFLYPDTVVAGPGLGIDFTELYVVGDEVALSGSFFWGLYDGRIIEANATDITFFPDGTITGLIGRTEFGGGAVSIAGGILTLAGLVVGGFNLSGIYPISSDDTTGTIQLLDVDLFNVNWVSLAGGGTSIAASSLTIGPLGHIYMTASTNDISGTYEISEVNEGSIKFLNAGLVNQAWGSTYNGGATVPYGGGVVNATLALNAVDPNWVGPFDVPLAGQTNFIANFIAANGLYRDNGTIQSALDVTLQLEYTPVSAAGSILGPSRTYTRLIEGSAITQTQRALTVIAATDLYPAPVGRFRARKVTPRDIGFTGQVVDTVQWKDLYVTAPITQEDFGNVTTIQTITVATKGALSLKSRKLNLRATRIIPILGEDSTFGPPAATKDFADILAAVCLDPKIGGRTEAELDLDNFRETAEAIKTYFNRNAPSRFSYTFDDDNISSEETITAIAEACFCTVYRRGNIIKLAFERETDNSSILFNHRNKVPGSEKRTITWGIDGNSDGIEYEYVDPVDSAPQIIRIPSDFSAVKPKTIKSIGVRSRTQAMIHANRAWNKIRYRRTTVEFSATREAELLLRTDRILVANNVRQGTQDGEVRSMPTPTTIITSQRVNLDAGSDWIVFLQATDGTVQSVGCTQGPNEYTIELDEEPEKAMSLDPANYAVATYTVVLASDGGTAQAALAFLVDERSYESASTSKVTAYNYDARYYENDLDNSQRIAHYTSHNLTYDEATTEQRDPGGFFASDDTLTIPATGAPPYVYDTGYNED